MYPPVKHVKSLDWETDCVKITPYEPNTLVVFPPDKSKNKRSNHAMGHTSQKTKYRKNILTFFPLINNSIWPLRIVIFCGLHTHTRKKLDDILQGSIIVKGNYYTNTLS